MLDLPFSYELKPDSAIPSHYDHHIERRLSALKGMFYNQAAYQELLAQGDLLLYEVYGLERPALPGELLSGTSIVHPGKVGNEFFMTKGHFHGVLETGEIYSCLQGKGCMVMESPEGDWQIEELLPGRVLYVPPRWAHRSVNTGDAADLVTFYVCPAHSGHDYGTIEKQGFRKLVVAEGGEIQVVDNPLWCAQGDH